MMINSTQAALNDIVIGYNANADLYLYRVGSPLMAVAINCHFPPLIGKKWWGA